MSKTNLPRGWTKTRMGNVAELIGGGTPSRKVSEYFDGDIIWLTPTEIPKTAVTVISESKEKITEMGLEKSSAKLIPKGSVLLTTRASIGYAGIAGTEVTTNQGFASFDCNSAVLNYYLAYWLFYNKDLIERAAGGTTFKEISKTKLRSLAIPLPPLNEQHRIVAKIESILGQIDAARDGLENVKTLLKRTRQSVLNEAFAGRLVPQDPTDVPAESALQQILGKDNPSFVKHDLPQGWIYCPLTQIYDINPNKPKDLQIAPDTEISFIPMKCVEELSGKIDLSMTRTYDKVKKGYTYFRNGDILFAKITPCMENGKIAIVDKLQTGIGFGSTEFHVLRMKDPTISNRFYFWYFMQDAFRNAAQQQMAGTAGQLRVPANYFTTMWIHVPTPKEQHRIVAKIESILGRIDADKILMLFRKLSFFIYL